MPFIEANEISLYYERQGQGPRLLVLLGTGSDLRDRPNILQSPLVEHFDVLVFDQRGQGQSGVPEGPYTMADYADDARALLAAVGWDSCNVLGISFGGMVAQELAIHYPDCVERLALCCTSSGGEGGSSYPLHELETLSPDERVEALIPLFDLRFAEDWFAPKSRPKGGTRRLKSMLTRICAEPKTPENARGRTLQLEARKAHDCWEQLSNIKVPTFLCGGRYDGVVEPRCMIKMQEAMPHAHLVFFEGGHLFFMEDPNAFRRIREFLLDTVDAIEVDLEYAMERFLRDDMAASREAYNAVLAKQPNHPMALFFLGELSRIEKNKDAAREQWQKIVDHHPDTAMAHLAQSQITNYYMGSPYEAMEHIEAALRCDSECALAYNYRADLWLGRSNHENATEDSTKAFLLDPSDIIALENLADATRRTGDIPKALQICSEAVRRAPYYVEAYITRAQIHDALGHRNDALQDYQQALTIAPEDTQAMLGIAEISLRQNQLETAMQEFDKILAKDPENIEAYHGRAEAYLAQGELDKAIEDLHQAIQREPTCERHFRRGYAYHQKGQLDSAISDYCEALYRDYYAVNALNNRGLAYYQKGQVDLAWNDFVDAAVRKNDDPNAYNNRALIQMYRCQFTSAIDDYNKAIELSPEDADLFFNRANAYEEKGDVAQAIADFEQYLKLGGSELKDGEATTKRIERLKALKS